MKFLLLVAICVMACAWLLRGAGARTGGQARSAQPEPDRAGGEAMVRCLHCGVHFPRSEAIVNSAGIFCSDEHRLQYGSR